MMTDVPSRARPSILQALALFQSLVSPGLLCAWMRAAGVRFYERLYTPRVVPGLVALIPPVCPLTGCSAGAMMCLRVSLTAPIFRRPTDSRFTV